MVTKPTLVKPGNSGGTSGAPVKPVTVPRAAPQPPVRPPAPLKPVPVKTAEPDPFEGDFESEVPTSGVPLEQAMELGLKGSQMFGQQPQAVQDDPFGDDFGEEEAETQTEEPEAVEETEGNEDDWDDNGEAEAEEVDPFADETPATAPAKASVPKLAPAGRKAFQILNENGTVGFDTKLVADLSTVAAAKEVWHKLFKPFADMTDAEKYTRNAAGEVLVRDREDRMKAARLLADTLGRDDDAEFDGDVVEATLVLGKDAPQAQSSDLGLTDPANAMMEQCHNRSVGCNSMRLNHMQGTGKCFYPDCPCKGQCKAFVSKGTGGEAAPEGTKSAVAQSTQQGQQGATVLTPARRATDPPAVQRAGVVPAGGAVAGARPNAPTPAGQGQRPQAPSGGSGGQGQNRTSAQAPSTQVGLRPATSASGTGVQKPQTQSGQQANAQAGVTRPAAGAAGSTPVQRPAAQTQSKAVAGEGEEPIITGDVLAHIVANGGSGPQHSNYWPTNANPLTEEWATQRRDYIIGRFVKFYSNAVTTEKPLGEGKTRVLNTQDFKLNSTSYRVVLAANKVNEAIEMYVSAPVETGYIGEPLDAKGLSPTDNEIIRNVVGPAAVAYIDAHKPLAADEIECGWDEYLQYVNAFGDNGLEQGMLIHEWQKTQQAQ
jgi:hypothetical protein